jgi:uncharacterized protein (DUF1810 family)
MDGTKFSEFVKAQDQCYKRVLEELGAGRKMTHWMWFIFPQISGLGSSAMAARFAISSLDEAERYLQHPLLGQRLRECTQLVLKVRDRNIDVIFGAPDDAKFRSCMTLFAVAAPEVPIFCAALDKYFDGTQDSQTLKKLRPCE